MRKCKKCEVEKDLAEFVKSKTCLEGRRWTCKECWKVKGAEYYVKNKDTVYKASKERNREKNRLLARKYFSENKQLIRLKQKVWYYSRTDEQREKANERSRRYSKTEKYKEWAKKYKEQRADKFKATEVLNNAVRDGKLKRLNNCQICKNQGKIEAHHPDYSKPLDVVWLCQKCHRTIHK